MIGNHWLAVQVFTDPDKIMLENFRVIEKKNILMEIFKFFFIFTTSVRYFVDILLNDFDLYIFCKFPFDMYQSIFVVNGMGLFWKFPPLFIAVFVHIQFLWRRKQIYWLLEKGIWYYARYFSKQRALELHHLFHHCAYNRTYILLSISNKDEISDSYQYILWRSMIMFDLQRK